MARRATYSSGPRASSPVRPGSLGRASFASSRSAALRRAFVAAPDKSATRIPADACSRPLDVDGLVRVHARRGIVCRRRFNISGRAQSDARTSLPGLVFHLPGSWSADAPASAVHLQLSARRMKVSVLRRAIALRTVPAFLGLALPVIAAAQGTATLTGRIVDTAGVPIQGAS